MKLIHEKYHPNGFKVFLAFKLSAAVDFTSDVSNKGIRNGCQLQTTQHNNISICLDPNSAVLMLFHNSKSKCLQTSTDLQWLDWEISLQDALVPYFQSLAAGKDDKGATTNLKEKLNLLNSTVHSPPSFFHGENVSATDVVLFGALLPLFAKEESRKLLETYQELFSYLKYLRDLQNFKQTEILYYGEKGVTVEGWAIKQVSPLGSEHSLWDLLKEHQNTAAKHTRTTSPNVNTSNEEQTVTAIEINDAKKYWEQTTPATISPKIRSGPILPVKGERNILITSALPYVNNVPHLGNIIGCVLSADCFARFCRIRGDNIVYICGTDEYGTATETKALSEGSTPQQICDKYHVIHAEVYKWFNIKFDFFGRTTTKSQTTAAQNIFWNLQKNQRITQNTVEQLYCSKCERFLADRFVEGTCHFPGCGFEDARGDQCDGCGKLINATELIKPRCKLCTETPSLRGSTHLFLDLPKIEEELKVWLNKASPCWTYNAKVICESWLRDGLKERCITRDLKWGTPVPLEGFHNKVFYVWYDAPIGYISMSMEYTDQWEKWWKDPDNVLYYQFMAKDNVPFHGVIFPSCLIGTKENWTKVTHLIATEYLNYEDGKFSKSRGNGVFGDEAKQTGIISDIWRFYLLYVRPEAHDTAFSWVDLQTKNNSELLNNLGNFINRALKFVYQFFNGEVPVASPVDSDFKVMACINQELEKYTKALAGCKLKDGIRCILSITRIGNQYIQENEPYKLVKADRSEDDKKRGATVISISSSIVALVAVLLEPYMPDTSSRIMDILNQPLTLNGTLPIAFTKFLSPGHRIKEPFPLIRKITDEEIDALKKKFSGTPEQAVATTKKDKPTSNVISKEGLKVVNVDEIGLLEKTIADQGTKVRELKSQGASKDVLGGEIQLLLQLKEKLAIAQGLDPAEVKSGSKKNKKKK